MSLREAIVILAVIWCALLVGGVGAEYLLWYYY